MSLRRIIKNFFDEPERSKVQRELERYRRKLEERDFEVLFDDLPIQAVTEELTRLVYRYIDIYWPKKSEGGLPEEAFKVVLIRDGIRPLIEEQELPRLKRRFRNRVPQEQLDKRLERVGKAVYKRAQRQVSAKLSSLQADAESVKASELPATPQPKRAARKKRAVSEAVAIRRGLVRAFAAANPRTHGKNLNEETCTNLDAMGRALSR